MISFLNVAHLNTVNMNMPLPIFDIYLQNRDARSEGSCASLCLIGTLTAHAIAQQRRHQDTPLGFQAAMTCSNSPMFLDMEI